MQSVKKPWEQSWSFLDEENMPPVDRRYSLCLRVDLHITNALSSVMGSHSIASDREAHSTANEVHQWAHTHGHHWSYHISHHPEAATWMQGWSNVWKSQLQHSPSGNALAGWRNAPREAVYVLKQHSMHVVRPIARICRSRNQRVEMGMVPHSITPRDSLSKCCYLSTWP